MNGQTRICKICLKPIHNWNLHIFFKTNYLICAKCEQKLVPHFYKFSIGEIGAVAIYKYDEEIRGLLYQLKGCYDIELGGVFLDRFKDELKTIYHDYYLVPAPSSKKSDREREFNHVRAIFNCLKLPYLPIVEKSFDYKQSELTVGARKEALSKLRLIDKTKLYGKKILIVDDVFTTGATVQGIIKLVKTLNPKKIRVLVMSKTFLK